MAKELTEKQQKFLDVLFDEANGDVVQAKVLAGYAPTSSTSDIVRGIKEEVLEATQMYMARNAPRAAVAMVSGINDPTELGLREKMTAAKELLDRTGLVKTEKMQVETTGGVMLMPVKNTSMEEDED
jgi:phage terminase small subunit